MGCEILQKSLDIGCLNLDASINFYMWKLNKALNITTPTKQSEYCEVCMNLRDVVSTSAPACPQAFYGIKTQILPSGRSVYTSN